jgi:hypothetical protein
MELLHIGDEHHDVDILQFEVGEDDTGKFIQFVGRANQTFNVIYPSARRGNSNIHVYKIMMKLKKKIVFYHVLIE